MSATQKKKKKIKRVASLVRYLSQQNEQILVLIMLG
jgi:hypothetical protein